MKIYTEHVALNCATITGDSWAAALPPHGTRIQRQAKSCIKPDFHPKFLMRTCSKKLA